MRLGLGGRAPLCIGRRLVTAITGSGLLVGRLTRCRFSWEQRVPKKKLLNSVLSALSGLGLRVPRLYRNSRNDQGDRTLPAQARYPTVYRIG